MKIKLVFDDGTETEISKYGLKELAKALNEELQDKKVALDPWGKYPYSTTDGRVLAPLPSQCGCIKTNYFVSSTIDGTYNIMRRSYENKIGF